VHPAPGDSKQEVGERRDNREKYGVDVG